MFSAVLDRTVDLFVGLYEFSDVLQAFQDHLFHPKVEVVYTYVLSTFVLSPNDDTFIFLISLYITNDVYR